MIDLLGLGPEGWVAAPDKRLLSHPVSSVPLNPLKHRTLGKPPRRKKITTQVWEGCPGGTHVSVNPEPTAGRKPPALLAFFTFLLGTVVAGLSCPLPFACT
jgi:hypothetical protein